MLKNFTKPLKDLFKKYFIAGILVLVPVVGTIWILKAVIVWGDNFIYSFLPGTFQPRIFAEDRIPGIGLIFTISIILGVGIFARLYLGKKLLVLGDKIIDRIPFGRSIYHTLQQIMQTAFTDKEKKFKGVCLVEYPRSGSYTIAFITNDSPPETSPHQDEKYLRIFVPTTPNPTSGFMLIVPEKSIKPLEISIEDATKIIISGGLLT